MSSSPAQETNRQPTTLPKLSWEELSDDLWPSDDWVVGADLDPALLPDVWPFLTEGGS